MDNAKDNTRLRGAERLYQLCLGSLSGRLFVEAEEYAREFVRRFPEDYRAHICILKSLTHNFSAEWAYTHETSEAMRKIRLMAPSHMVEATEKHYQAWVSTLTLKDDNDIESLAEIAKIQLVDEIRYTPEFDLYIDFTADQLDEIGIHYIQEKNFLDAATVYQSFAIRFPKDHRAWWGRLRAVSQDFSCFRRPPKAGVYFAKFRQTAPKAISEAWSVEYYSWSQKNRMAPNRRQYQALMENIRHQRIRERGRRVFISEHYDNLVGNAAGQHTYMTMLRGVGFAVQGIAWFVIVILVIISGFS